MPQLWDDWKPNRQIVKEIMETTDAKMRVDPSAEGGLETYHTDSERDHGSDRGKNEGRSLS